MSQPEENQGSSLYEYEAFKRARQAKVPLTSGGGGDGPTDGSMEQRVSALEKSFDKMDAKLDRVLEGIGDIRTSLARVEERLEAKANSSEVSEIKGRVSALPTTLQLILLVFAIMGGAFAIVKFAIPHTP